MYEDISLWDQQEYTRAMTSWPIFHGPLTLDFGQIIKGKIFVQGRISRPINGSKLIFHIRIYLYETSRNIQEPWPHDLYFMVLWLQTLTRLSRLRFLSKVESQNLLMVTSWYFIWDQQEYTRAMTSWPMFQPQSADFRLRPIFHGQGLRLRIFMLNFYNVFYFDGFD